VVAIINAFIVLSCVPIPGVVPAMRREVDKHSESAAFQCDALPSRLSLNTPLNCRADATLRRSDSQAAARRRRRVRTGRNHLWPFLRTRSSLRPHSARAARFPRSIAGQTLARPLPFEAGEGLIMRMWLCGLCVAVALPVSGGDRMTMTVTPAQAFAPSPLRVRVRIEPSAENRTLTITADSAGFYRSSEIPLEGDRAPRTIELEFRGVPEGEYDITGVVKDSTGHQRSVARRFARVLSFSGSF
jgi:hypothetical protein